ncbi:hypothetical protein M1N54_01845 [Thermodesulfovibrionales bacterium]|nr:hypothetical protein [Thermodesulfovibrionales bacterium]
MPVFDPHPRGIAFGFHPDGMKEKTDLIGQAGQGFRRLTQIMKRKKDVRPESLGEGWRKICLKGDCVCLPELR